MNTGNNRTKSEKQALYRRLKNMREFILTQDVRRIGDSRTKIFKMWMKHLEFSIDKKGFANG